MSCTIKVEFNGEMRRFMMPEDTDMEIFDAKLREIFPALEENKFSVYYRDQEGDVVRIGSTEELHHAWQGAGPILRLAIQVQSPPAQPQAPQVQASGTPAGVLGQRQPQTDWSPAQFFADPFSFFDTNPFSGLDLGLNFPLEQRQMSMKHKEEQLKSQREYESKMKDIYKQRQQHRENFLKGEAERFCQEMDKRMNEDSGGVKRSKSGTVIVAKPQVKPQVGQFGSWDPVSKNGPGWSSTTWGPVGYELHYYCPGEEGGQQGKEDGPKEDMETKPTSAQ